jgi:hypothetical protein
MEKNISLKQRFTNLFQIDFRALVAFRIALGLLIIADLILRLPDIVAFYTDFGFAPRIHFMEYPINIFRFSFHNFSGLFWFQIILFYLAGIFAFCLILGYRTRTMSILSFIFLLSLHNRNELVLQGGDNLFHIMTFWAIFLPLGARFSLDALWSPNPRWQNKSHFNNVFSFAYLIQIALAFFFAGILKSGEEWTKTFTASSFAGHVNYLSTFIGREILKYPILTKIWTIYLKWTEILLPILMFVPIKNHWLRIISVFLLWVMLIGCGLGLQIALFPMIWSIAIIPFLPSQFWDWFSRFNKTSKLKFYFDEDCSLCTSAACALRSSVETSPTKSDAEAFKKMLTENTMIIEDETGKRFYKFEALVLLLSSNLWTKPFGMILSLKVFKKSGEKFYTWLANHRHQISKIIDYLKPNKPLNLPSWPVQVLVGVLIFLVTFWNIYNFDPRLGKIPEPVTNTFWALGLNQRWDMFAPNPIKVGGWYVMPGKLEDGTVVDVYHQRSSEPNWGLDYEPPKGMRSQGWRKFLVDFLPNLDSKVQLHFGGYMCRRWNQNVPPETPTKRLKTFQIFFMRQITLPDGNGVTEAEKVSIWEHKCYV